MGFALKKENIILTCKSKSDISKAILQAEGSFIVTDIDGNILSQTKGSLIHKGYDIKIFNPMNPIQSSYYNPLDYITAEEDVNFLANCISNPRIEKWEEQTLPFYNKAGKMLLMACIYYLKDFEVEDEKKDFSYICHMLRKAGEQGLDEFKTKSALDKIFEKLPIGSNALIYYEKFKKLAGDNFQVPVIISCIISLDFFEHQKNAEFFEKEDSLNIDKIQETKTAIYSILPKTDRSYDFLIPMIYGQTYFYLRNLKNAKGSKPSDTVQFFVDDSMLPRVPLPIKEAVARLHSRSSNFSGAKK